MSMIDFEPSLISGTIVRSGYVAVVFPKQVMYGESSEDQPSCFPLVHCELQIHGGRLSAAPPKFPVSADNIQVEYRGGTRKCFLPTGFAADGPVRVYAEVGSSLLLLAEGEAIELAVVSDAGFVPVTWPN